MSWLASLNQRFSSITADSRKVVPGALFLAYPGVHQDGRNYIAQAISAGAAGVIWEAANFVWNADWKIANRSVAGLKDCVGEIAAEFYEYPSKKMQVVGVTGTNGKTSVTQWLAQALTFLGKKTAVIGTIGNGFVESQTEAANTTPDAVLLQAMLAEYQQQGAQAIAMEVSSHGLHQGRVKGVTFDVAALTNLSRDHLDYHNTMEDYAAAKAALFSWPGLKSAVLNADEPFGQALVEKLRAAHQPCVSYGLNAGEVRGSALQLGQDGLKMEVSTPQGSAHLSAPVLGRFNAYNLLAVLAVLLNLGVALSDATKAIANIRSVSGRMQQLGGKGKPLVVVDYAHTPDALEKVLSTLREQMLPGSRLICVFGCGGNRDAGKRALMGEVAGRLADHVVVTSDNPRHEDPMQIIAAIRAGLERAHTVEVDRGVAIKNAVNAAGADDVVLVAGKGHEHYQEINGVKLPFSDVDEAAAALLAYQPVLQMEVRS